MQGPETATDIGAYLDQMRDSLIGRIDRDPPVPGFGIEGYQEEARTSGWDRPSRALSMIGAKRMQNLRQECERVLKANVPGDFLEAGVWRGGACIMMRAVLKAYGVKDRRVFAADSFAGPPRPSRGSAVDQPADFHGNDYFAVPLEEVTTAFKRYGLLDDQVVFLPGLFRDTLPKAPLTNLAVLRLDGDLYESTMDGLNHLYAKVSPGGAVITDDYFLFQSQREAVDEFRAKHGIQETILQIDDFGGYWIKS
jgi:O-methyltransferase